MQVMRELGCLEVDASVAEGPAEGNVSHSTLRPHYP